jgi:hypothetical protein
MHGGCQFNMPALGNPACPFVSVHRAIHQSHEERADIFDNAQPQDASRFRNHRDFIASLENARQRSFERVRALSLSSRVRNKNPLLFDKRRSSGA